jgi:branched-subunit amino acid aminotransferase/4-amino-4-deoxychorismate lyase
MAAAPLTIREQVITLAQMRTAREVFVTNSTVGIVPVTQIDAQAFPVGEETQALKRWLEPPTPPGKRYHFVNRPGAPR